MASKVWIPSRFNIDAIDSFTRQFVKKDGGPSDDYLTFDFKGLNFIDGSGITVLRNSVTWLLKSDSKVEFVNYNNVTKDCIKYLDDCGFFEAYLGTKLRRDGRCRSTTLPCRFIERSRSFSFIDARLSPFLASALHVDERSLAGLRSCMKEIFNNIADHSTQTTGFVHVQHYPKMHKVKITVSDFGVGIPSTIRKTFGDMTDANAILLAAQEGVTSQSQPNNMGAGLNYLLDCVSANGGEVVIHSQSGFLRCFSDRSGQRRKGYNRQGRYPGTLVDISIDSRLFRGDDYDDDRSVIEW